MIRVRNLSKVYRVHGRSQTVLDRVDFEVQRGQKVALMGRNGAGKSTLIRLIGKVELPTAGTIEHGMRVSWPLGFVGAFQGSLTGLDNMRFLSRIYRVGFEPMRRFIEDFSELGEHLYKPVKMYSSGMRARLAFGLSIAIDFDCYLIDEVILVGDQRFHQRCMEHLFDHRKGRTLIIASHDVGLMAEVCDTAMIIRDSRLSCHTDVKLATEIYRNL